MHISRSLAHFQAVHATTGCPAQPRIVHFIINALSPPYTPPVCTGHGDHTHKHLKKSLITFLLTNSTSAFYLSF